MRLLASPAPYAGCLLVVVASLVASYFVHPYVFAFTALILGFASAALAAVAILVCAFKPLPRRTKLAIHLQMGLGNLQVE